MKALAGLLCVLLAGCATPLPSSPSPSPKVETTWARLGMWRRLSRCYEETALGAKTWLEVACLAYLCGRLRAEPT